MRVLVAGATGVIGRQLVPALVRFGAAVTAIGHSGRAADQLVAHGAEYRQCDAMDFDAIAREMARVRPDAVVNLLTAIPRRLHPRRIAADMRPTNRLRKEGTQNLMRAATAVGTSSFVSQSIAFAYAPASDRPAEEHEPLFHDAPGGFNEVVDAIVQCEEITLATPSIRGAVLRYGYLYGEGTSFGPGGAFFEDIRRGRIPLVGRGSGTYSFVHVADAAAATADAAMRAVQGVFNIVDDCPAAVADWLPSMASLLGARPAPKIPGFVARLVAGSYAHYVMTGQRGASNAKARGELGWSPRFPNWSDGMQSDGIGSPDSIGNGPRVSGNLP